MAKVKGRNYFTKVFYFLQIRMAKSPEAVDKFLSDLAVKLQPLVKEEKVEMLKLKEEEVKGRP
jgi:Zn-dependent oligopeptidase